MSFFSSPCESLNWHSTASPTPLFNSSVSITDVFMTRYFLRFRWLHEVLMFLRLTLRAWWIRIEMQRGGKFANKLTALSTSPHAIVKPSHYPWNELISATVMSLDPPFTFQSHSELDSRDPSPECFSAVRILNGFYAVKMWLLLGNLSRAAELRRAKNFPTRSREQKPNCQSEK